jgi:hypothetical protein
MQYDFAYHAGGLFFCSLLKRLCCPISILADGYQRFSPFHKRRSECDNACLGAPYTHLWRGNKNIGSISSRCRAFSLSHCVEIMPGDHLMSCSMGTWALEVLAVKMPEHFYTNSAAVKNTWNYIPLLTLFLAWYLIEHRDNFTTLHFLIQL